MSTTGTTLEVLFGYHIMYQMVSTCTDLSTETRTAMLAAQGPVCNLGTKFSTSSGTAA
eukprot:SAG31_NODE_77_length_27533_cov_47.448859_6_plen_58_part_00